MKCSWKEKANWKKKFFQLLGLSILTKVQRLKDQKQKR